MDAGAPVLALKELKGEAPELSDPSWARWARLRLRALQADGQWRRVIQLADDPHEEAPSDYRQWAQVRAARQELAHDRPGDARRRLAALVALFPEDPRVRSWLRGVYEAYAGENRQEAARVAVMRHRMGASGDAADLSPSAQLEQARILAEGGAREEALAALGDEPQGPERRRLRVRLLIATGAREQALKEAREWADAATGRGARLAWEAVAEAAEGLGRPRLRVKAREEVLRSPVRVGEGRVTRVERAWEAYLRRGEHVGNEAGLLVGDDERWLELAGETEDGIDRRSLLATVALLGRTAQARETARLALADALADADKGVTGIRLFAQGPAFQAPGSLTDPTRVRLARLALAEKRFHHALSWMDRVEVPPGKGEKRGWWLNRARLRVRLGDFSGAARDVEGIGDHSEWLADDGFRDRLLQILFDLQEADRHQIALRLFRAIHDVVEEASARRELLFWMAESRQALENYRQAATLYLRSAAHPGGDMGDPWSRTARFRAAKALTHTRHKAEARRLFRNLLGTGSSPQDLAIQRQLRQLDADSGQ
ncbi:hypothetical protein [Thiohalorhabdus sp.]|uniref:hypothetical protein n=1 Tax=Thiohalorhabdus sp. TaxID=3094134 RepID=UPI002FC37D9B